MEEGEGLDVDSIYRHLHQSSPSFLLELPRGIYLEKQYDMVLLKKGRMKPLPPFEVEARYAWSNLYQRDRKRDGNRGNRSGMRSLKSQWISQYCSF